MRFDRPLGVGARGGHGPIGYVVEAYWPGRSLAFRFTRPKGFHGGHRFEALPGHQGCFLLRHTIEMEVKGRALLSWALVIRPLHDALLEDALATARASVGMAPRMRPWSPWVRILRWVMSGGKAHQQSVP